MVYIEVEVVKYSFEVSVSTYFLTVQNGEERRTVV